MRIRPIHKRPVCLRTINTANMLLFLLSCALFGCSLFFYLISIFIG